MQLRRFAKASFLILGLFFALYYTSLGPRILLYYYLPAEGNVSGVSGSFGSQSITIESFEITVSDRKISGERLSLWGIDIWEQKIKAVSLDFMQVSAPFDGTGALEDDSVELYIDNWHVSKYTISKVNLLLSKNNRKEKVISSVSCSLDKTGEYKVSLRSKGITHNMPFSKVWKCI